jgi:hypothetical protein
MFGKYDKDQDQAFSPQEVVNFFSTCPRMPWGPEVYYQVPVASNALESFACFQRLKTTPILYFAAVYRDL